MSVGIRFLAIVSGAKGKSTVDVIIANLDHSLTRQLFCLLSAFTCYASVSVLSLSLRNSFLPQEGGHLTAFSAFSSERTKELAAGRRRENQLNCDDRK